MVKTAFRVLVLMAALLGIAACGDGDEGGTTAASDVGSASTTAAGSDEPILIKTRVDIPTGRVLSGSTIGDTPFCAGGTFVDKHGSEDPSVPPYGLVDRTFRCPDGSLRIGFTPGEPQGRTQAGPWRFASGTGSFKALRGSGQMKIKYEPGSDTKGRETFTGTVTR
ncbi:MAG: hypothetical protein QOI73_2665 [Solirubrobacteraceae bacterium]|nr:hypothetical protein [Solirubrobacteraceae bacterium]